MIIDAGGGTVDFSAYAEKDDGYEEVAPTACKPTLHDLDQLMIFFSRHLRRFRIHYKACREGGSE